MEETGMLTCIKSQRQRNAAEYALKKVDELIYKLYGITNEEIREIENN